MGSAINAISDATKLTVSQPLLIVVAAVLGVGLFFASLFSVLIPFFGVVISFLATPVFLLFMTGLTYAAYQDRSISMDECESLFDEYFVDVTVAYILGQLIVISLSIATLVLLSVFVIPLLVLQTGGIFEVAPAAMSVGTLFVLCSIFGLYLIVSVFAMAFIQFLDVAVIIGEKDSPTDAIEHSFALILENPVSIMGYICIRSGIAILAGIVPFSLILVGVFLEGVVSLFVLVILGVLLSFLALPVSTAYQFAYHVAYYEDLVEDENSPGKQTVGDTIQ